MAGHLSPPIQAPATPPVPSPTQSSVLHCCLHGNATVFAPRPPASQGSLSEEVGQLQPEAPNCPPTLPPQVPLHFLPEGQGAGPASGRSCPWDWLLSRHGGCLSSSCFHPSAASLDQGAARPTLLAWGAKAVGGQPRPLGSGHWHLVGSCGIALRCSPVCFPHAVPIWGGHGWCRSASLGKLVGV